MIVLDNVVLDEILLCGCHADACDFVIRNNIIYMNNYNGEIVAGTSAQLPFIKADHNLVFGPKYCSQDYPNCVEISNNPSGYPDIYGNVTLDPKFVNLITPNLHLQNTSPAIDLGIPVSWITTDYDGNTRPYGSAFDVGAFEYVGNFTPTSSPSSTPPRTATPIPTNTYTPIPTVTRTLVPTVTPTPTPECIRVVFKDGTRITVCKP